MDASLRSLLAGAVAAVTLALAAAPAEANILEYDFAFSGDGVSGAGVLETAALADPLAPVAGGYDIVALDGTLDGDPVALLGEAGGAAMDSPDGFFIYDNIFYPAGSASAAGAFFDLDGLLLETAIDDSNVYYDGTGYIDYADGGTGTPVAFTARPVPEPSSLPVLGAALFLLALFMARDRRAFLKRSFDLGASFALLVAAAPVMLVAALAIALDDQGPILYWQERVGRGGAVFRICKLRTMRVDAERPGAPQWAAMGDPRVTRVGRILRYVRIDELPQLANVLAGEMSLVGPRPERPVFVAAFEREIPFYAERHKVRPGITGWAQVNYPYGASLEDARRKLEFDLHYVRNAGLLFDLMIVLVTPKAVLVDGGGR